MDYYCYELTKKSLHAFIKCPCTLGESDTDSIAGAIEMAPSEEGAVGGDMAAADGERDHLTGPSTSQGGEHGMDYAF